MHVREARHPVGGQGVDELDAIHVALALEEVLVEVGVGDSLARAERLEHTRKWAHDAGHHPGERRHVTGIVAPHEHLGVAVREPVASLVGGLRGVVHLDEASDGLLL